MKYTHTRLTALLIMVVTLLSLYSPVKAEFPYVGSFNVPSLMNSEQAANLSWTIGGGGHSLMVFCEKGIKFFYSKTGGVFPCNSKVSVSKLASDTVALTIVNLNAEARTIRTKVIPKYSSTSTPDYDIGGVESSIYVQPSQQPIDSFYSTATTTVSGSLTNLYWSSKYLDGVNLSIACNGYVTASSSSFGSKVMPCGGVIFPKDLPPKGSISILFNNLSPAYVPLEVAVIPATAPGIYNGIRSKNITLSVASDAQKPITTAFTASRTRVPSGDSISFNWAITNGSGANIKFSCSQFIDLRLHTATTTLPIRCDEYIQQKPLSATGSTTVTFVNRNFPEELVTAIIVPFLKDKTYDESKIERIRLTIGSSKMVETAPVRVLPNIVPGSTVAPTTPAPASKIIFVRPLDVGSRGDDVKLLQLLLAKDKTIYPEGLATGYFGSATKRALGKLQLKYGLVTNENDPGYGFAGPKTRVLLNSI